MKKVLLVLFMVLILCGCGKEEENHDFDEIEYIIPDEFEETDGSIYSKSYYYRDDDAYCYIYVRPDEKDLYNEDKEVWFKGNIRLSLNDKVSDLKELDVNGKKVLFVEKDSNGDITKYYAFESSNNYYLLEYEINRYNDENETYKNSPCYTLVDEVINSVKTK